MYRIREVDGTAQVAVLKALHLQTFDPDEAPMGDFSDGYWWIAYLDKEPVAFAGICKAFRHSHVGYFSRVGVLKKHRGHALQRRLMRCLEAKARRVGWSQIITDTRFNNPSANNLIAAGYRLYTPPEPWGIRETLYWTKDVAP